MIKKFIIRYVGWYEKGMIWYEKGDFYGEFGRKVVNFKELIELKI